MTSCFLLVFLNRIKGLLIFIIPANPFFLSIVENQLNFIVAFDTEKFSHGTIERIASRWDVRLVDYNFINQIAEQWRGQRRLIPIVEKSKLIMRAQSCDGYHKYYFQDLITF